MPTLRPLAAPGRPCRKRCTQRAGPKSSERNASSKCAINMPELLREEWRVSLDERERWQRLETQKKVSESIWSVNA